MHDCSTANHPGAWFPSIEANQGLWSLLALALALFFAWLEFRRANRAEAEPGRRFKQVVLGLLDEAINATDVLRVALAVPGATNEAFNSVPAWTTAMNRVRRLLQALTVAPGASASGLLLLDRFWAAADTSFVPEDPAGTAKNVFERRLVELRAIRTELWAL